LPIVIVVLGFALSDNSEDIVVRGSALKPSITFHPTVHHVLRLFGAVFS
jgi:hypothetical protein